MYYMHVIKLYAVRTTGRIWLDWLQWYWTNGVSGILNFKPKWRWRPAGFILFVYLFAYSLQNFLNSMCPSPNLYSPIKKKLNPE